MISAIATEMVGCLFRWFPHNRIAEGEGRGDLPHRGGNREVPRGDEADGANRITSDLDIDIGPSGGEFLTGNAQGLAGEEAGDMSGPHHLAKRVGDCLATLAGEYLREAVLVVHDATEDGIQNEGALFDGCPAPAYPGGLGSSESLTDHVLRGCSIDADDIIQIGGIADFKRSRATKPFAANEVFFQKHCFLPLFSCLGQRLRV